MPEGQGGGLLDLEKELTCPICTDVLYQPLTVLDCLHTCCGSCLREWFAWQASKATNSSPYTCPSCRAAVRGTRPNATVTTLLEHLIRVHPEKSKSQEDRDEIARAYKPGDNVTPTVDVETESEDSDDEHALEQARYLSLRDVDPERTRRRAERSAHNARARRAHEESARTAALSASEAPRPRPSSRGVAQRRQVEHQSSLRSLLSASDIDDEDIREDIMRQIANDGLLDGVDLSNMTHSQEEEVIERIAQALQRSQARQSPRSDNTRRTDRSPRPSSSSRRGYGT
ncbi:LON peptidase N-terminal domain and RING finger protein [Sphaceloma murrayae]|uniref:LON peptidase N-terminal domain and RING finger protein n=1 Tax=Sphaceloma murrayae TaxID=2082308 RepID=A0A2K1QWV8_9PEZI|nr:LON peptidase N-terminal domain and RING finger protein [Sphaceloma murrayae]